jgi:hypothetical protein
MRHLLSLILAVILAPLIYVTAGFAIAKWAESEASSGRFDLVPALLFLAAILLAGALYALLVLVRLSPLGLVLAGLTYLGVTVWGAFDPYGLYDVLPHKVLGVAGVLTYPVGPVTGLLAVPLLFTIFSPRRWRRYATPQPAGVTGAPAYPTGGVSAAPSYGTPSYGTPSYGTPSYSPPSYGGTYVPPSSPTTEDDAPTKVDALGGPTAYIPPNQPGSPENESRF